MAGGGERAGGGEFPQVKRSDGRWRQWRGADSGGDCQ